MSTTRHLILLTGDQLGEGVSALAGADPQRDVVVMGELVEETTYVPHHRHKIALVLAGMRHRRDALRAAGFRVDYRELDAGVPDFGTLLAEAVARWQPAGVLATEPGEWRVRQAMDAWPARLGVPVQIRPDTRFICDHERFRRWAGGRRELRMEYFYREMRRHTGLLMEGDAPAGGRWNFDTENRAAWDGTRLPERPACTPDALTRAVCALVDARFPDHPGRADNFAWPVTAADAQRVLDAFLDHALPHFGRFQDALVTGEPFLFHSLLSAAINTGLLDPLAVCRAAEARWQAGRAPLPAAEGFIRQILGWREYVRGLYWLLMPDYAQRNALQATRPLPGFYWTGDTGMRCVREAVGAVREHGYAHHIQRLMVTGNFALLAGLDVAEVCAWYLALFVDAFEWVELPNTLGMALHADGGVLGSKPYCASGRYIDRQSDHCRHCRYDVKQVTGDNACPFNALYWDFIDRHAGRWARNARMTMPLRTWQRMDAGRRELIRARAAQLLEGIERL